MSEDINRLKELSGIAKEKVSTEKQLLVEQVRTWQEKLPDGTVRTHRYDYSDERQGDWRTGQGNRQDIGRSEGPGRGTGVGPGTGTGSSTYGTGPGSGTIGTGRGQVGTGTGAGTGTYGTGRGQTGTGQGYGTVPGSGNGQFGTGAGSGYGTIQRIPGVGSGGYTSPGYGSGTGTYGTSPDVGTYSTSPGSSREYPTYEPDDEPEPVERPQKGKRQKVEPQDDTTTTDKEWDDIPGYVNPSWAREQERLRQLQQQPREVPPLPSATTSLGRAPAPAPREPVKTEPPKEVPTLPSATTSLGRAPAPASIAKDLLLKEPPKEVPPLPSATTSLGRAPAPAPREPVKAEPPKEVPTLPSATTSLGKLPTPQTITAPQPAQTTINVPTDTKPVKEPITPNVAVQTPKVISTTEPSTWTVEPPSDKKDEPVAPASPAPAEVPTSVAKDILLPPAASAPKKDEPSSVELIQMTPDEIEKTFGPMPSSAARSSEPKGQPSKGTPTAGSGSPGSGAGAGAQGAAGASGQQGGGTTGKKYVPITPKTMAAPISGEPSWAAKQRAAQGTPFPDDPKIEPPKDITGTPGSIQAPSDTNADIVSKGQKATMQMSPADAAKAGTNVFKPNTIDVDVVPQDSGSPRELTITPKKPEANVASQQSDTVTTEPKDDKATESINRMLTLAGLK